MSLRLPGDKPRGRHRSHVWTLAALLSLTTLLYSWNLASSGYSDYYSTAAKSMSVSWKAFFLGAFDPQSTITLDKLSGFLIPQALSARIFGFSQWSLALPQVVEGVITVAAAYYIFCRWSGRLGGVVGAATLAFAPLMVSMFSHGMEDAMLTMCTTLALAAWQRGMDTDRRRWMILAGAFIGLGFQAKMAQAWLVMPAMGVAYLWINRRPLASKARVLAAAGGTALVVSLSWMVAIALVPPAQRPYIDGTTDNSIFSMVFGYNGINRFLAGLVPGALAGDPLFHPVGNAAIVGAVAGPIGHTPLKFFLPTYATQIGWLFPVAAAGIVLGLLSLRKNRASLRTPGMRTGVIVSAALLVTVGMVLGAMSLPHTAYLAGLMVPVAGLTGIGVVLLLRTFRDRSSRLRFVLPLTVAAQTVWSVVLLLSFPAFAAFLVAPVAILGFGGALALTARASGRGSGRRFAAVSTCVAIVGSLLAPAVWTLSTLDSAYAGTANDAYGGQQVAAVAARKLVRHAPYGIGLDSNRTVHPTVTIEDRIYDYAQARSAGRFAVATDSWRSASPLILEGETRVLPLGGFTSRAPSPTPAALRALVEAGDLRFVLETPAAAKTGVFNPNLDAIGEWVGDTCRVVPPSAYLAGVSDAAAAGYPNDRLFDCAPAP